MEPDPDRPRTLADRLDDGLVRLDDLRSDRRVVVGIAVIGVALVAAGWWLARPRAATPIESVIPQVRLETTSPTAGAGSIVVHVVGAVRSPGVYELASGARALDALDAAGGALPGAELDQLNLAGPLPDGAQIRIPAAGEQIDQSVVGPQGPDGSGPVDLNRADADELESLPGVGPATAAAIVGHRERSGPFTTIEDLLDVPGIGPAKLAALADLVTVR